MIIIIALSYSITCKIYYILRTFYSTKTFGISNITQKIQVPNKHL